MSDINNLCQKLDNDLKQIDNDCSDILKKSERSIYCIESCLKQLKEYIYQNTFSNQEEEIEFFKKIKPPVYSRLIFLSKYSTSNPSDLTAAINLRKNIY